MTCRVPVIIDRLTGDLAIVTTPTERYRAADIAVTLHTSLAQVPGSQLTATRTVGSTTGPPTPTPTPEQTR
ncbi:hypothetical protein ACIQC7_35115 [Kitasatospora sp. NPDC088556]|uniref:hypothetical protein n=1 Tax=Kitasatospora sp. NPDC088556 TaxID=3364076 RepID=UPI003804DD11